MMGDVDAAGSRHLLVTRKTWPLRARVNELSAQQAREARSRVRSRQASWGGCNELVREQRGLFVAQLKKRGLESIGLARDRDGGFLHCRRHSLSAKGTA